MPDQTQIVVGLNAVIVAVTDEEPRFLVVPRADPSGAIAESAGDGDLDGLPYGPLDAVADRTLDLGVRRWVREQAGLELGYVEQLYTFGDRHRDPRERLGGPRVLSIGYLALVREARPTGGAPARWRPWYELFPWEDWRSGHPKVLDRLTVALEGWVARSESAEQRRRREERVAICFGLGGAAWDAERVLDRYELLYEVGLVREAGRDRGIDTASGDSPELGLGRPMGGDHRRILATALSRLRGKIRYRPVVFELLPPTFTLLQLQRVVEALAGARLHKQNFRRLVEKGGLVEGTGRQTSETGGRPAELFHFRREVLRERPAPGVGLPSLSVG